VKSDSESDVDSLIQSPVVESTTTRPKKSATKRRRKIKIVPLTHESIKNAVTLATVSESVEPASSTCVSSSNSTISLTLIMTELNADAELAEGGRRVTKGG
jgi:hypothetical protein